MQLRTLFRLLKTVIKINRHPTYRYTYTPNNDEICQNKYYFKFIETQIKAKVQFVKY